MGLVISSASTSLDGFVAHPDNSPGPLFDWYDSEQTGGDVAVANAGHVPTFMLTPESAEHVRAFRDRVGALVVGRTLFDVTDGWRGRHPLGVPVVVLTHEPPTNWSYPGSEDFHFVTDGIEAAIGRARELAGDGDVGVAAGVVATQAFDAGLLDAVAVDLVPVFLGEGHRYFTSRPGDAPRRLGDPTHCVRGARVTHLVFPVERG